MGIRLVYGLKTDDVTYLDSFYPSRRLAEAASALKLDYGATIFSPGAKASTASAFCSGHVALLRGELPLSLYDDLESRGIVVVNSAASVSLAADKLASSRRYASIGAAHPLTLAIGRSAEAPPLGYPFIVKPRYGRMGRGVALMESERDWLELIGSEEFASTEFIAQEYVEASRGRDVRFFFARFSGAPSAADHVVALRRSEGLASNAHSGGRMEPFSPPQSLRPEAARIFADSGLTYGTVDFLFADERGSSFIVCETNACPGFEALERMSGLDVAKAILLAAMDAKGGAS